MKKLNLMNLTIEEKNDIYDYIVDNKIYFIYKKSKEDRIKYLNDIISHKVNISFSSYEDCIEYLTNHWDKKCKYEFCSNNRKTSIFPNRIDFNNCSIKYGIYKYCSKKCSDISWSIKQTENNTSHKMTDYVRKKSYKKQSIKMKENIRLGKFIPNITNSWAKSMCEISFIRDNILVNIKTRSSWEAYFQLFNTNLLYEKVIIQYKFRNEYFNYIVDFLDPVNKILYEIKPNSEMNTLKNKAKFRWARKWCEKNSYKYIIINNKWFKDNYNKNIIIGQPCEEKLIRNLKQFNEN